MIVRPGIPDELRWFADARFGVYALLGRGVKGAPLRVRRDTATGTPFLAGWMTPDQLAHWEIDVARAGEFAIAAAVRPPGAVWTATPSPRPPTTGARWGRFPRRATRRRSRR
jgi:hypothetical protein